MSELDEVLGERHDKLCGVFGAHLPFVLKFWKVWVGFLSMA